MSEATPPGEQGRFRAARRAGLVLGGALAAVGLLYGVALAVNGSGVPRGTQVLGLDIGGRTVGAAQARLDERLPDRLPTQMTVVAADERITRDAADLGLAVDFAATASRAMEGWASPMRSIPALFGAGRDVEPVLDARPDLLAAGVAGIDNEVGTDLVEGALTFDTGQAVAVEPKPGRGLDQPATAAALERAFSAGLAEIEASVIDLLPEVTADGVTQALAGIGQRAVSGPVTITVAKDSVELTPQQFGPFLSTAPDNGTLRLVVDAASLVQSLEQEIEDLGREPRDARFEFVDDDEVKIIPGRPAIALDEEILVEELADVLVGEGPRIVDAGARTEEPEFTTEDAEALGITEKLGSFRTEYPYAAYRVTNIGRAAELINGSIVEPGEIWSLNNTVGERTVKNGFVRGFIIRQGQFVEDLGGGVSQSATTTFNAIFFAGLKVVEQYAHSLYISRYPAGREATVAFGQKDLRFENDSGSGVYIQAVHRVGSIEVTMWGTKVWDEVRSVSSPRRNIRSAATVESDDPECEPQSPVDGFDITVTRIFERDGEEVKRESFNTHYDPTDRIVCVEEMDGKDDRDEATPSPDPKGTAGPDLCAKKPKTCPKPAESPGPSTTTPEPEDESPDETVAEGGAGPGPEPEPE